MNSAKHDASPQLEIAEYSYGCGIGSNAWRNAHERSRCGLCCLRVWCREVKIRRSTSTQEGRADFNVGQGSVGSSGASDVFRLSVTRHVSVVLLFRKGDETCYHCGGREHARGYRGSIGGCLILRACRRWMLAHRRMRVAAIQYTRTTACRFGRLSRSEFEDMRMR